MLSTAHVSITSINIFNFNTYFIRKICYYSHCTYRETKGQESKVTSLCLHNGEDLARQSAVSQCFLKWFNKFWFLRILFNDIISFCLFKICNGYFIVVINSIICFLVFLKIKASRKDDMEKLVLLCVLFTCAKEEYLVPHVDRAIFFRVKRVRSGESEHFDLSFFLIRDTLMGNLDAGQGGPLSLSFFLQSRSYSATNACTRKQNLFFVMGALKNLVHFNQFSFLIYSPPLIL